MRMMNVYLVWVNDDVMHVFSDQIRALNSAIEFVNTNTEYYWEIRDSNRDGSVFYAHQPEGPYKRLEIVERTVL